MSICRTLTVSACFQGSSLTNASKFLLCWHWGMVNSLLILQPHVMAGVQLQLMVTSVNSKQIQQSDTWGATEREALLGMEQVKCPSRWPGHCRCSSSLSFYTFTIVLVWCWFWCFFTSTMGFSILNEKNIELKQLNTLKNPQECKENLVFIPRDRL